MDLLDFAAREMKKGRSPSEIRKSLVDNGYPVYEVENALAVNEEGEDEKIKKKLAIKAPGYILIMGLSVILLAVGSIALVLYFT